MPVPETKQAIGVENEIDRFIRARLDQRGFSHAPAAAPERWLRRVTFDLTGLPPSREDLDAFLADKSPDARARAVDRLLASPRYGEKMAVDWLDVARYADSFGYQSDIDTHAWPYRDWVIGAFNDNLPWDQFITWQIAGDLLPNPDPRTNHRHRLQPHPPQDPGRRQRGGGVPAGGHFRPRPHLRHRVPRADLRVHPLPRSQVRSAHDEGLLLDGRVLQLHRRMGTAPRHRLDPAESRRCFSPRPSRTRPSPDKPPPSPEMENCLAAKTQEREPAFQAWLAARPPDLADLSGSYDLDAAGKDGFANAVDPDTPGEIQMPKTRSSPATRPGAFLHRR